MLQEEGVGGRRVRLTLRILKDLEAYLAACQLGITMASLGLGWVGEPFVAALLEPLFVAAGMPEALLHTVSFAIGFLIFSSLHIVVGEQVPKTMAIRRPEPMSLWVAWPLYVFYMICWPLNWALNNASRALLRLAGVAEAGHEEAYSPDELRSLIGASRVQGTVRKHEHDMLGAILDLERVEVVEVMTHRRNMVSLDGDAPVAEIARQVLDGPHTRYPVWRGDPDTIVGVLHAKDVLGAVQRSGAQALTPADIRKLATPPWFIPDTTSLVHQLVAFRQRRAHLAFVVDEYGALMGLVTLEDILEEIVGDIVDEKDVEMAGVRQEPDGGVLAEGRVTIRDLNRPVRLGAARRGGDHDRRPRDARDPPHPAGRRELHPARLPLRGRPPPAPPAGPAQDQAGGAGGRGGGAAGGLGLPQVELDHAGHVGARVALAGRLGEDPPRRLGHRRPRPVSPGHVERVAEVLSDQLDREHGREAAREHRARGGLGRRAAHRSSGQDLDGAALVQPARAREADQLRHRRDLHGEQRVHRQLHRGAAPRTSRVVDRAAHGPEQRLGPRQSVGVAADQPDELPRLRLRPRAGDRRVEERGPGGAAALRQLARPGRRHGRALDGEGVPGNAG
jgi:CBS domain containing-hemolysin-like protein